MVILPPRRLPSVSLRPMGKAMISTVGLVDRELFETTTCFLFCSSASNSYRYVWLVPVYTTLAAEAATRFDLIIQKEEERGWSDLAHKAGGDYRYLRAVRDENCPEKIVSLQLKRSDGKLSGVDFKQYHGHTGDINAGRLGSFLHLTWQTHNVPT